MFWTFKRLWGALLSAEVSIILLAHQHLAWKLPTELSTAQGPFLREVFWMDLAPLLRLGQLDTQFQFGPVF